MHGNRCCQERLQLIRASGGSSPSRRFLKMVVRPVWALRSASRCCRRRGWGGTRWCGEVGVALADGLEGAVQLHPPGAVAVAQHAVVLLAQVGPSVHWGTAVTRPEAVEPPQCERMSLPMTATRAATLPPLSRRRRGGGQLGRAKRRLYLRRDGQRSQTEDLGRRSGNGWFALITSQLRRRRRATAVFRSTRGGARCERICLTIVAAASSMAAGPG